MQNRSDSDSITASATWASTAGKLTFALALLMSCAAATATLPAAVDVELKAIADVCREVGGKPDVSGATLRADLTADGTLDYVVDVGAARCEGAASIYGDREKGVSIFVTDAKGKAFKAFSDSSFSVRLETAGKASKLWLTVMGRSCGKAPARDFASEHFCERALRWNAKARTFDYAPISTVRQLGR